MKIEKIITGNTDVTSLYALTDSKCQTVRQASQAVIDALIKEDTKEMEFENMKTRTMRSSGIPKMGFSGNSLYGILGGGLGLSIGLSSSDDRKVKFVKENKKDVSAKLVDPVKPDINYPVKAFFNLEKLTTVLVFKNDERVKVVADEPSKGKNAHNGVLIALARRILGKGTSLSSFYDKYKSDAKTEAMFYGVVMGYFVSKGIVKDAEMFDRWMVEFLTTRLTIHPQKK